MNIELTPSAQQELLQLDAYLAERSPARADHVLDQIYDAIESLPQFPLIGRQGRVADTREVGVSSTPYLLTYRFEDKAIQILAVLHGTRRWLRSFDQE
jgi:toxin ParE1/3/4